MNRIKILRKEHNLTQKELANKLGLSTDAIISLYEKGERNPSMEILNQLSTLFNCSIDYLLGKSDVRNPKQENDINEELLKVGFDMKNYNPPTDKQKEQIKALLEVILKDNKKDDKN